MSVLQHYLAAVEQGDIEEDALQRDIIQHMDRLDDELMHSKSSWIPWKKPAFVRGLYIYGPVGAGKTFLANLFYEHISEGKKARFHFHHFMQQVDSQLRRLQGSKDPVKLIAQDISKKFRVLFFDEFLVNDVAYAMILAELLQALMKQGVIMVFTSNTKPDDLYLNGVHRERFIPAIELIKNHCEVLNLVEQRDYRLGREPLLDAYLYPLNTKTQAAMERQFLTVAEVIEEHGVIPLQSRNVPFYKCSLQSIWFDFDILCNLPRSQLDYLELADRFFHVFLSDIPQLTENHTAQVILFVLFIDVMYDRGIKVVISADVAVDALYTKGEMLPTFKRTLSRLQEMQSHDYLRRHPKRVMLDKLG